MPFFIIVPIWAICITIGASLLLFRRVRFLSSYILFGSTIGLLVSFVFSLAMLLGLGKLVGGTSLAWLALVGYIITIGAGGILGVILGLFLAKKVNNSFPWLLNQPSAKI
jgi:hypothetical protein